MKGYVHLDSVEHEGKEAVRVSCYMQDVDRLDKFQMLESLCRALEITEQEWMLYVCLKDEGVFDWAVDIESVTIELPTKKEE